MSTNISSPGLFSTLQGRFSCHGSTGVLIIQIHASLDFPEFTPEQIQRSIEAERVEAEKKDFMHILDDESAAFIEQEIIYRTIWLYVANINQCTKFLLFDYSVCAIGY